VRRVNSCNSPVSAEFRPRSAMMCRASSLVEISHTRTKLRQLIIDLDHIDAAIRIFDPSYDVERASARRSRSQHTAHSGAMRRGR
jgi:hypothetical protein